MTTIKKKPFSKLLASVVLTMLLSFGFMLPAFAADSNGAIVGDETNPAEAAITKVLELPVGTSTPNASFEFLVTPVAVDGSTDKADLDKMPVIGTDGKVTIDLSAGTQEAVNGGVKQVSKESADLFENVKWTHTGVYTYRITEVKDTYTLSTSNPIEQMTYSDAEYDVTVFVSRAADGTLYVKYIGTVVVTPGAPGQEEGEKVDPTPGGDPDLEGDYSKMIFTNNYLLINTPEKPDPITDGVLVISKAVAGGELADPGQYFDFDVTVFNPETVVDPTKTYKAYVVDAKGIVSAIPAGQAPADTIKNDGANDYIEFTTAELAKIQLKDGQSLSFIDLPVGSSFTVMEIDPKNYTASYTLTIDGKSVETVTAPAAGASLGLSKPVYTGEKENSTAFTNTYRDVTPMGIAVDNLPYLVLIGIALLGLAGFIAAKARKKSKNDA
ncbi:MAG: hypothetical protein FWF91_07210 [Coriobacteriia bacterium]|nr:hypothetical protein [Coriobacteriia bacterium]